jgi:hypothetical protein
MTDGRKNTGRDDHGHCGARKRGGGNCTLPAGWGTDHVGVGACKLHGGSTPNHQKAARREQARLDVVTLGLPRDISPEQALLEEVKRAAGHVAWLEMKVAELEPEDVIWGVAEQIERPAGIDGEGAAAAGEVETKRRAGLNMWVQLYHEERKRLVVAAEKAVGADAQGRMVAVFEQIGSAYRQMFDRVLDQLDLDDEQRARVPGVVTAELRQIAGGAA